MTIIGVVDRITDKQTKQVIAPRDRGFLLPYTTPINRKDRLREAVLANFVLTVFVFE